MAERLRRLASLVVAALCAAMAAAPAAGVVGGAAPADPAAWPWAVALLDAANPDPVAAEVCTGTLIRGEWVLTAAHCVVGADGGVADPAGVQVGAGAADLAALTPDRRLPVSRVVVYPGYTPSRFGRDVALLRLARPSGLPPAALGAGFRTGSLKGWVAGFGLGDGARHDAPHRPHQRLDAARLRPLHAHAAGVRVPALAVGDRLRHAAVQPRAVGVLRRLRRPARGLPRRGAARDRSGQLDGRVPAARG